MRYIFVVFLILSLAIGLAVAQEETPEPDAPFFPLQLIAPMEADELGEWIASVDPLLEEQSRNWYLGIVFNSASNTRITWFEACCKGIITVEEIRFCCVTQIEPYFHYEADMLPYYQYTLTNFMPYELVQSCEVGDIRIHLFKGYSEGYDYYIQHFHKENGLTIRNTGFYFRQLQELEDYRQLFFPDITCPDEVEASEESL
jgi:hypothetical protein